VDKNSVARPSTKETHELRECPGCYEGLIYDTVIGAWVDHDGCSGTGKSLAFLYPKAGRLSKCDGCGERFAGREMVEVVADHQSLTFFVGDEVCRECAADHGVV
jgi:hypothetical protein